LAADTLWGHIAWGYRYRHGAEALERWLKTYDGDTPPMVISDPLPAGYLPRPALPHKPLPSTQPSPAELDRQKSARKQEWIAREQWMRIAGSLSSDAVDQEVQSALQSDLRPPAAVESSIVHASINRLTGGTVQEHGGTLYATPRLFYPRSVTSFEVWTVTNMELNAVRQLFEDGLAGGYGRDASGGCGWLTLASINNAPQMEVSNANAGLLLGMAVPKRRDPTRGWFNFGTRCGRLGGDFAIGATPAGSTVRQKRPVHCLLRGSIVVDGKKPPAFIGRLVPKVHEDAAIRHYAISPVLPCRLDESSLKELPA
jgi:CRISPR-associated protein Csm4